MIAPSKSDQMAPPTDYQDWISLFARVRNERNCEAEVFEALSKGTLGDLTESTANAFREQLVQTVNMILDRGAKRFVKELNESIAFNDLCQVDILFIRLKKDVRRALFFESLSFLGEDFIKELSDLLKKQMTDFWQGTLKFLYEQSIEFSNSQLEDALYTVKRIKLFE